MGAGGAPRLTAAAAVSGPPTWRSVLGGGRGRLSLGLVLVELVAGMQSLVVVSVMPRVLDDLGDVRFYGLVFSGYMLSGLVSIPLAGREADRFGPARPFLVASITFTAGTLLATVAPSMLLLAAARCVQGYGGGALYTIGYGVVTRAYPPATRPRMVALLTAVWVVSGLVAPGAGAAVASGPGWRWAFAGIAPLAVLALVLVLPGLRPLGRADGTVARLPLRWPLLLAVGTGLFIGGLATATRWGPLLGLFGLGVSVATLPRMLPAGTLRARPGAPAAIAAAFLLNVAFMTVDSFVTLALTAVRHRSLAEAGVAVTLVAFSWTAGSWWQARVAHSHSAGRLTRLGAAVVLLGTTGFAAVLLDAPLWLAYASWTVAGAGMGIAYSTVLLASMSAGDGGDEMRMMAARMVSGRLGIILGTGVGGAFVAAADAAGRPVSWGLGAAFAVAIVAAAGSAGLAGRLQ